MLLDVHQYLQACTNWHTAHMCMSACHICHISNNSTNMYRNIPSQCIVTVNVWLFSLIQCVVTVNMWIFCQLTNLCTGPIICSAHTHYPPVFAPSTYTCTSLNYSQEPLLWCESSKLTNGIWHVNGLQPADMAIEYYQCPHVNCYHWQKWGC